MKHCSTLIIFYTFFSAQVFCQELIINNNPSFNGECTLVVNPKDEQNLIVAWMQLNDYINLTVAIAVCYSHDGGSSWSSPQFMPHAFENRTSADPTLAFNADGICYLGYIDYKFSRDSGFVYISESSNNGESWTEPAIAIDLFDTPDRAIDRPWIAIDQSDGPFRNRIYVTTKNLKDAPFPHHIWLVYSDDGITFSEPKIVDFEIEVSLLLNTMGVPTVSADGKLFIAYLSYDLSASFYPQFIFAQSNDGGATLINQEILEFSGESAFDETDTLYQFSYCLSANPINSSNLILSYTDNINGDPDIYSICTYDDGLHWSTPMRLNDDAINNDVGQDMCWGSFNLNGIYVAAWRDRREGGIGQVAPYKIVTTSSSDGGTSFSENLFSSTENSPLFTPVDGNDFLGIAANSSCVFLTWEDFRNNENDQLYFNQNCVLTSSIQNALMLYDEVKLFPNPTNECINIEFNLIKDASVQIEILNTNGACLIDLNAIQVQNGKSTLQISIPENFISGNYICSIKSENFARKIQFNYNR